MFKWHTNNQDECYDLLEVGAIETEEGKEDAVVAKVYDMQEFINFCESPDFPDPPSKNGNQP